MRALVAGIVLALLGVSSVAATAPSISVNEPGPYAVGDVVTLTIEVPKLKGYEYPVVLMFCDSEWTGYFRRWDTKGYGYPNLSGPEPVTLTTAGQCHFELWAYHGLHHDPERFLATTSDITVNP